MIEIESRPLKKRVAVRVPGSKSYSHRFAIAAALADGTSSIRNLLESEDVCLTKKALMQMGASFQKNDDSYIVKGVSGRPLPCNTSIYLGNSGTSMRLLAAICCLGAGSYVLTGNERMKQRPIGGLVSALEMANASISYMEDRGFPPVQINSTGDFGGKVLVDCSQSSQYLSALLLAAPCTGKGMRIIVEKGLVSRPYIDITLDVLDRFGIDYTRDGYTCFEIPGKQAYQAGDYLVEPDSSHACYFWASAAITGNEVLVHDTSGDSKQGDTNFVGILEKMGCAISFTKEGISVKGPAQKPVEVDMGDMPDAVPTLAVVASFVPGTTVINNISHLAAKESDRLYGLADLIRSIGVDAVASKDSLVVYGGSPSPATIDPSNDHRIAMSFALAGLRIQGIRILNPQCVEKSFPDFWKVFRTLYD